MLKWSLAFFVVSIIAGLLGFTSVAGPAMEIAKVLFFIFIFTAILFLIFGILVFNKTRS